MSKLFRLLTVALLATSTVGCDVVNDLLKNSEKKTSRRDSADDDDDTPKKKKKKKKKKVTSKKEAGVLADVGFRPEKDGFGFRNTGGKYPMTDPVLNEKVMVKLFGPEACIGGDTENCSLTLPAFEWANMINRAMNGGQCEGMAVASLTYFKKLDKPNSPMPLLTHEVSREEATPLIAYYWSYQALDPVMSATVRARRQSTPVEVEDELVKMLNKGELATIAFWNPRGRGGHAVTPYAIEDKGNDVHWIKIYDNNYPDTERYIVIDRKANTWRYDLAALNPSVPKMPWDGGPDSHNIVVLPLDLRLQRAACPFCETSEQRVIWPRSAAVSVADQDGNTIKIENGEIKNNIPGAEVVDLSAWTDGTEAVDPIYFLPAKNDYDVTIEKGANSASAPDDEKGVAVFGAGTAVTVEGVDIGDGDKDTLSLAHGSDGVRYKSSSGRMPALKFAVADAKQGVSVRVANLKGDADSEFELNLDRKSGKATIQGGGKSTESYDLELRHVGRDHKGVEKTVQKRVPFKLGESHSIDTARPTLVRPGSVAAPKISRGRFVLKPKPAARDDKAVEKDKDGATTRPIGPIRLGPKDAPKDAPKDKVDPPRLKPTGTTPAPKPTGAPPVLKKGLIK